MVSLIEIGYREVCKLTLLEALSGNIISLAGCDNCFQLPQLCINDLLNTGRNICSVDELQNF